MASHFSRANSPFGGSLNMKPSSLKPTAPAPFAGVNTSAIGPMQAPDPAVMPQPFDPNAELAQLQAGMNIGLSESEGAYQTGRTAYLTGYNASGQRDTSNPYSQAQLLENSYRRSLSGTGQSYGARGLLYSSARQRALGGVDRNYAESSAGLRDQAADTYHGINVGRLQTYAGNVASGNQSGYAALRQQVYGS